MATVPNIPDQLDLREQIARIDKMQVEISKIKTDIKFAPWQYVFGGIGAGAALLAAATGLVALLFN